jgi:precorrin-6A/cobalt-precorrin-6A reductase
MKVLVVGGTADGRQLATQLFNRGFNVIYSIAGEVRKATLPCPVVSGGFSQFGGLKHYVLGQKITHIVDATDPSALKMSNKISLVSQHLSIPTIRFQQPPWIASSADHWIEVTDWHEVIRGVSIDETVLLSAGQVSQVLLNQLAGSAKKVILRTAMPVKIPLPDNVSWLKAVGPFQLADEIKLLKASSIDAVISKNNGGSSTYAKIAAAAELNIPVYLFKRSKLPTVDYEFESLNKCIALLFQYR